MIAELGRTCLSAFAVFDEQYQCMETASGYKAIHKIHYTRLTKRALQIPVGHTHQMNLNLSHSAEGILSIVQKIENTRTRYLTIEVKWSNDRNQRKGNKSRKGGTPDNHRRPRKNKPHP